MRYAQIDRGQRLHLVYEAGEGRDDSSIVRAGYISLPLCGRRFDGNYRMTINVPLANACRNCRRVFNARHGLRTPLMADNDMMGLAPKLWAMPFGPAPLGLRPEPLAASRPFGECHYRDRSKR